MQCPALEAECGVLRYHIDMMIHALHQLITALLPSTSTVYLTAVTIEQASVVLQLTATAPTASWPCCMCPHPRCIAAMGAT